MGRHTRRAARRRVPVSAVVLGSLIVTVVAVGSLLSSYVQPTAIAADGIERTTIEETVTDGRLLPYGLVLAALLAVGAAAAVWIDARRGGRDIALAAHRGPAHAVVVLPEAAPDAITPDVPAPDVPAPEVAAPEVAAPDVAAPDFAAPDGADTRNALSALFADRGLLVDRTLSSVDLSFPSTAGLAESLHDELFTHRTVRS